MDKFVVLSMSGESKDVAKALSNDTAISIMNKLAETRMSATELSKQLKIPISTVQYNLDLLKNVNLIVDTAYRYSEKGKKVLYYEPAKKLIILAPEKEKASILNLLKNKLLVPIILGISAASGFLGQTIFGSSSTFSSKSMAAAPLLAGAEVSRAADNAAITAMYMAPKTMFYQQPWFIFFLGALFATIAIFVAYKMVKK
jgi:DNA-binding transcriptional ArsR family regulator